jgi:hypothetical protein
MRSPPSPVRSCAGSRWGGRCWPCCRCGLPTSLKLGLRFPPRSWGSAVCSCWCSVPRWTRCSAGCGRLPCWRSWSGWWCRPAVTLRNRSRRWLLYPVIGMLTVAAVGGGYETVSAATDAPPAMPGRSIDVVGHSLHLHCTGTGSPTVVLQPGGGAMSSDMGWIAPRSPPIPASASTTARVAGRAKHSAPPRTHPRSPPTSTPCCDAGTSPAPTCWQATPSVGCMC